MTEQADRTRKVSLRDLLQPSEGDGEGMIVGPCGPDPEWLRHGDWQVFARATADHYAPGRSLIDFTDASGATRKVTFDEATGNVHLPFSLDDALMGYLSESWRSGVEVHALSSGQLQLYYRAKKLIPRRVQLAARRLLIRRQGTPQFPRWPYDPSVQRLLALYVHCLAEQRATTDVEFTWFWPDGHRAAAILTHDVESAEGLRLAVQIADLEESHGFRSSFNVVADWYPIDHGILRELSLRGFEIGVHGVHHDRSMFSSRASFEGQLGRVAEAAGAFGARGFRSPATHRVYAWLADLPVEYDCTIPHSDPYEPIPGGCCAVWPFFIGDVVELPYTLPQDHTTFTLLRQNSAELWYAQAERVIEANGLVQVVSHPDPGYLGEPRIRRLYADFLGWLRLRDDVWHALPRDVAAWWKARDREVDERAVRAVARTGEDALDVSYSPIG